MLALLGILTIIASVLFAESNHSYHDAMECELHVPHNGCSMQYIVL